MPSAKMLSASEKDSIKALRANGISARRIAVQLGRSDVVVSKFLKDPDNYGTKKHPGRPKKLSERDRRRICRIASNSMKSAAKIGAEANASVSKSTILRMIRQSDHLVSATRKTVPRMTESHKKKRLDFARENMARNWKKVVFSDEKKFNLDGPDGIIMTRSEINKRL